ncbi:hypothetical protein EDC01DRAFT_336377 [Geopyxis carbonaria]|nr:hypothetical protein EDC01DRAFT_336377 [Geopyxis carbonaria]
MVFIALREKTSMSDEQRPSTAQPTTICENCDGKKESETSLSSSSNSIKDTNYSELIPVPVGEWNVPIVVPQHSDLEIPQNGTAAEHYNLPWRERFRQNTEAVEVHGCEPKLGYKRKIKIAWLQCKRKRAIMIGVVLLVIIVTIVLAAVMKTRQSQSQRAAVESDNEGSRSKTVESNQMAPIAGLAALQFDKNRNSTAIFHRPAADGNIYQINCVFPPVEQLNLQNNCTWNILDYIRKEDPNIKNDTPLAVIGNITATTLFYFSLDTYSSNANETTHSIMATTPDSNRTQPLITGLLLHESSKLAATSPDDGKTYNVYFQAADLSIHEVSETGQTRIVSGAASAGTHLAAISWPHNSLQSPPKLQYMLFHLIPLPSLQGNSLHARYRLTNWRTYKDDSPMPSAFYADAQTSLACAGWALPVGIKWPSKGHHTIHCYAARPDGGIETLRYLESSWLDWETLGGLVGLKDVRTPLAVSEGYVNRTGALPQDWNSTAHVLFETRPRLAETPGETSRWTLGERVWAPSGGWGDGPGVDHGGTASL